MQPRLSNIIINSFTKLYAWIILLQNLKHFILEFLEKSIPHESSIFINSTFCVNECPTFLLLYWLFDSLPFALQGWGRCHLDPEKQKTHMSIHLIGIKKKSSPKTKLYSCHLLKHLVFPLRIWRWDNKDIIFETLK